ncbi:MAG TPA: hypothetical protein P5324_10090, partial [Anaerohalosphaeraceae bacterium]|nr:hypothetical protein [Anaerohalosphaeraceae bacterium]HRV20918.1 hypothetical protein [Anaerohalosphaeraceae bacterium]
IKGLKDFHAAAKVFRNHTDQFSADPFGAGQFITNCDWYQVETPAVCRFQMDGPQAGGSGTLSEPGPLKMDVHLLWPQTAEMMVADYPENLGTAKKLWYAVRADGQTLAEGRFGAWILGADQIDVALEGKTVLELETRVDSLKNKTIFWAEAVIVTADGKEIPLTRLPLQYEGLIPTENFAQDYYGGKICIAGKPRDSAVGANPQKPNEPGLIRVNLSGLHASRLKAVIGGDYPLGPAADHRKTVSFRSRGSEARFIMLIEPYENDSVIAAVLSDGQMVKTELKDGRVQVLAFQNLDGNPDQVQVEFSEYSNGKRTFYEKAVK